MMTVDIDDVEDNLILKATYPYKNTNPSLTCPALNHYNQGAKVIILMIFVGNFQLFSRLFFANNLVRKLILMC